MKRKLLAGFAAAILAGIFYTTTEAQQPPSQHAVTMERVLQRVRSAFLTQEGCRGLFSGYRGDPRPTLDRATFIYVGEALDSAGFAAATLVGSNLTFLGASFYQKAGDVEGMATLVIHELLHQQGAGAEIDNYAENYERISKACGTRNAAGTNVRR